MRAPGAGLADHQLKELAYTVFLGCSAGRATPELAAVMRAQLEVRGRGSAGGAEAGPAPRR